MAVLCSLFLIFNPSSLENFYLCFFLSFVLVKIRGWLWNYNNCMLSLQPWKVGSVRRVPGWKSSSEFLHINTVYTIFDLHSWCTSKQHSKRINQLEKTGDSVTAVTEYGCWLTIAYSSWLMIGKQTRLDSTTQMTYMFGESFNIIFKLETRKQQTFA